MAVLRQKLLLTRGATRSLLLQRNATQCNTAQDRTGRISTAHHTTPHHSTAQHTTAQHSDHRESMPLTNEMCGSKRWGGWQRNRSGLRGNRWRSDAVRRAPAASRGAVGEDEDEAAAAAAVVVVVEEEEEEVEEEEEEEEEKEEEEEEEEEGEEEEEEDEEEEVEQEVVSAGEAGTETQTSANCKSLRPIAAAICASESAASTVASNGDGRAETRGI